MDDEVDGAHDLGRKNPGTHAGKRPQTFQPGGHIMERGGVEGGSTTRVPGVKSLQHVRDFSTANLADNQP
jgi:hypothetical protein